MAVVIGLRFPVGVALLVVLIGVACGQPPAFMDPVVRRQQAKLDKLVVDLRGETLQPSQKRKIINDFIDRILSLCIDVEDNAVRTELAVMAVGFAVEQKRFDDALKLTQFQIDGATDDARRADLLSTVGGIYELKAESGPGEFDELSDSALAAFEASRDAAAAGVAAGSPQAMKRLVLSLVDEANLLRTKGETSAYNSAADRLAEARQHIIEASESENGSTAVASLASLRVTPKNLLQSEIQARAAAGQRTETINLLWQLQKLLLRSTPKIEVDLSKAVLTAADREHWAKEEFASEFLVEPTTPLTELKVISRITSRLYGDKMYRRCHEFFFSCANRENLLRLCQQHRQLASDGVKTSFLEAIRLATRALERDGKQERADEVLVTLGAVYQGDDWHTELYKFDEGSVDADMNMPRLQPKAPNASDDLGSSTGKRLILINAVIAMLFLGYLFWRKSTG